ncbi:hypothetical protein PPYR_03736 [Photinus pyralis]|uniref:Potassium channel domain-containing protein n=3 Tax=Photinus pyralis TaxID=7054 RepID=A0A5N4A3P4_PHOPY|nr:uncharacterized protein LOC116161893 isoform X2 [Photinus pyralis]KAB0791936.1 hypothetical protein PPYR_03736 [Photinus pyralis]
MSGYYDPEGLEQLPPSTCNRIVCYAWKTITFLISHITLITVVVAYCLGGAKMFESLEKEHEIQVKNNISIIRQNITNHIWNLTKYDVVYLEKELFTNRTKAYLRDFEAAIFTAMTKNGWDGNEKQNETQWTFEGALFYSIIVITTIGYGHIAPKTDWGKVATIFYAILGIPLMLLCLSNVGDILATSFRFLYWKICCYVCTKRPRRRRNRRHTSRSRDTRFGRSRTASFRRSVRNSTRSADSGFGFSETVPSSYSDPDLRYHDEHPRSHARGLSVPPRIRSPSKHPQVAESKRPSKYQRASSLDRKRAPRQLEASLEPFILANAPVLCNRYVIDLEEPKISASCSRRSRNLQRQTPPIQGRRTASTPRSRYLEPPITNREPSPESLDSIKFSSRRRRPPYSPSPKIMSPLGFGTRQRYTDEMESDQDYPDDDYYDMGLIRTKPVPIWLCVLLVLSYIIAGMFLFHYWEGWDHLDAAYFCFITLTTIGFGDFVPSSNKTTNNEAKVSIAFCSLYLLFGISLLAMSFNLVQEEVLAHVRRIAKTLGIIKKETREEEVE